MYIDKHTSRKDLLDAVYSERQLLDAFISAKRDPELMETEELRKFIIDWIEAGDECQTI
jgi:hypothetical protein